MSSTCGYFYSNSYLLEYVYISVRFTVSGKSDMAIPQMQ